MKTTITSAALVAALTLLLAASCNKEEPGAASASCDGEQDEIALNTSAATTRGYVTGPTFYDTAIAELHAGEDGDPSEVRSERPMKLSAYLHPQTGEEGDYFVDYTFERGADGLWHHSPKIYWPLGGTLDFLAYSSMTPFNSKDVEWNTRNASENVTLTVLEDRTQDDILFCSVSGRASGTGADAVPMQFKHAQAWLEFRIKVANADMEDKIAIEKITVEDIYDNGELTIENNNGDAAASWSFRRCQSKDVVFDDDYGVYGSQNEDYTLENAIGSEVSYMDMLLPEQAKTSFVISYVLAGQPNRLKYRYTLSSDNWLQGNRYIYEIQFRVNELTVAPTVKEYINGTVTDLTPSEII